MCYHTSQDSSAVAIKNALKAPYPLELEHKIYYHANGFAHPDLAVLSIDNGRSINRYNWGLIPFWVKTWEDGKKIRNQTLNAKSETIFDKPSFRDSITKRRCIIPVNGFFEWKHSEKEKLPFFVHPKEKPLFNLAGIYSHWTDPATRDTHTTFSVITTEANELMAEIHNTKKRMPLIIDDRNIDAWINNGLPKSSIIELMQPQDDHSMAAHQVSQILSSTVIDSNIPEITYPI